jgi:hypothetical protein
MCDRGRHRPAARHSRFNHFVADCIAHKAAVDETLSLRKIAARWVSTVFKPMLSSFAIALLV